VVECGCCGDLGGTKGRGGESLFSRVGKVEGRGPKGNVERGTWKEEESYHFLKCKRAFL
jgi:hypothetical protein